MNAVECKEPVQSRMEAADLAGRVAAAICKEFEHLPLEREPTASDAALKAAHEANKAMVIGMLNVMDRLHEMQGRLELLRMASEGVANDCQSAALHRGAVDVCEQLEVILERLDTVRNGGRQADG